MQKKLLLCIVLIVALVMPMLSSCGFLGGESLAVEDIEIETLGDGSVRVTFYYLDADPESFTFPTIPGDKGDKGDKGERGEAGTGIEGIRLTSDGKGTQTMTITYTDDSMEPLKVEVKDGIHIVSTERVDDENGDPYLKITFSDGSVKSVLLPKGADGDAGVGIKNLQYFVDPETNETTVTLLLDNEDETKLTPFIIKPGKAGEPGKSIDRILQEEWKDEETGARLGTTVSFYLTDAEEPLASVNLYDGIGVADIKSEPLLSETGKKIGTRFYFEKTDGTTTSPIDVKDGVSIVSIVPNVEADGRTRITVTLSDGTVHPFWIPAVVSINSIHHEHNENGDTIVNVIMNNGDPYTFLIKRGVGIQNIQVVENPENSTEFLMLITYTDNTTAKVPFDKPTPWQNGRGNPNDTHADGNEGDYYFDLADNAIYMMHGGAWQLIVDLDVFDEPVSVTFSIVGQENVVWSNLLSTQTVLMKRGSTFATEGKSFPGKPTKTPTAEETAQGIVEYRFVGWSAVNGSFDPTVNGLFTDLTMVAGDMTLYPVWEAIYS